MPDELMLVNWWPHGFAYGVFEEVPDLFSRVPIWIPGGVSNWISRGVPNWISRGVSYLISRDVSNRVPNQHTIPNWISWNILNRLSKKITNRFPHGLTSTISN
jgi:hypothetical protein